MRIQRQIIQTVCAHAVWCSYPCLEAAVELGEVGVSTGKGQDALLGHGAVHVVVLQDHVLLQYFDGINVLRPLQLRKHHLEKRQKTKERGERGKGRGLDSAEMDGSNSVSAHGRAESQI